MSPEAFTKVHKRVEILDQVIEGRITEVQAGFELWIWERQIRKLLKKYRQFWEEGLVHGLVWKQSNNHISDQKKATVVDVIKQEDYKDCKPTFITEKLGDIYHVIISKETVRTIMIAERIWENGTKKSHKHRSRRPRKDFYGEMSQFDGSYHLRLEDRGEESCLLLDIDDATWKIRYAKLCDNEWYECVVDFWREDILINGVPRSIYLDKFSTYKVNNKKAVSTKEVRTCFDNAMIKLWCHLISANSPEAKWRVEKCNSTLQDRLVWELRLAKISTIEAANIFIRDVFIPRFNEQFGNPANKDWDVSIWLTQEQKDNLDRIFARESLRSLSNDYIIQYKKRCFQIESSKEYTVYPKKRLLVANTIDGKLHIHAWKSTEEKLVVFKEISYNEVNRNRRIYRSQKRKIEKERLLQLTNQRKEEKHKLSKERQIHHKAQRLIDKL